MGGVIAIDPGERTGWALFDNGTLVEAGTMSKAEILLNPPCPSGRKNYLDVAVIELPVIYPLGLGKGDPNQLIDLAVFVGDLRGFYVRRLSLDVVLVRPRTWKGTVPKRIHNARVLEALTPDERALLPRRPRARDYDHNMLDAVGLGLWQLRKDRHRAS